MPEKKLDPEIEALQAVHGALKPLPPDQRMRVLTSIYALLEIPGPEMLPASSASRSTPAAVTALDVPIRTSTRPLSINELVQEKSPGTNAQRIALFAYYRDKHEALSRFSRDDLKAYFSKAKEQPPRNYDRDFVEAVKKGWIHEDGADSYVTSKGIEAVESGFAGERKYTKHAGRPRRPGRPPKPKANGQRKARRARR